MPRCAQATCVVCRFSVIGGVGPNTTRSTETDTSSLTARGGELAGPLLFLNDAPSETNHVPDEQLFKQLYSNSRAVKSIIVYKIVT